MVDMLIKFVSCAELRVSAAHTGSVLLLKLSVEWVCPMDRNTAAGSASKQLQAKWWTYMMGEGQNHQDITQAATCNLHSLEHLKGEMQTCV
jgi:hypothetical protein